MIPNYEGQKYISPEKKDVNLFLKNMKQSLLKQAYDNTLSSKRLTISPSSNKNYSQTIIKSNSTANTRKSMDALEYQSNESKTKYKYNQPNIFSLQLNQKSIQKKNTDRIKLIEQKDILNTLQRHQSLQLQKIKQKRDDYKMQLQHQIHKRQQQKNLNRQYQRELYGKLPRNNSLKNKNNSFSQYYKNAHAYHQNNAEHYIQYFSNIKLKEQQQKRKQKEQDQKQLIAMKIQMLQDARAKTLKRNQLKRTLQLQIEQKKHKNLFEMKNKDSGYIKFSNNEYNTIYNPIDYGMDLNNKYVVNQIMARNSSQAKLT